MRFVLVYMAKFALVSFLIMYMFINASKSDWLMLWVDANGVLWGITWAVIGILGEYRSKQ